MFELRTIARPGRLSLRRIPITPSGIETATFLAVSVPIIKSNVRIKGYVSRVRKLGANRTYFYNNSGLIVTYFTTASLWCITVMPTACYG